MFKPENIAIHVSQNAIIFMSSSLAWFIAAAVANTNEQNFFGRARSYDASSQDKVQTMTFFKKNLDIIVIFSLKIYSTASKRGIQPPD